jgi:hypothetical protein
MSDFDRLADDLEQQRLIRDRLRRILHAMRGAPEISASMLTGRYAEQHGADERAHGIAAEMLARRWRLRWLRWRRSGPEAA